MFVLSKNKYWHEQQHITLDLDLESRNLQQEGPNSIKLNHIIYIFLNNYVDRLNILKLFFLIINICVFVWLKSLISHIYNWISMNIDWQNDLFRRTSQTFENIRITPYFWYCVAYVSLSFLLLAHNLWVYIKNATNNRTVE